MLKLILNLCRERYWLPMSAIVLAVCLVVSLAAAEASAHELEDGFVERSVAVVVRPGEATISYSIGANETTRQLLANEWSSDGGAMTAPCVVEGVKEHAQAQAKAQEGGDVPFLRHVGEAVMRRMTVEADGEPIGLELVEVMPTPRHHVEATVVMRVKLPSPLAGAKSILLKFHDRNFKKCRSPARVAEPALEATPVDSRHVPVAMGGAFRYALKGANGVILNRSTVGPILVRAKRKLVAEIPAEQLAAEQQFSAEVILP